MGELPGKGKDLEANIAKNEETEQSSSGCGLAMWLIIGFGLIVLLIGTRFWWVGRRHVKTNAFLCLACNHEIQPQDLSWTMKLARAVCLKPTCPGRCAAEKKQAAAAPGRRPQEVDLMDTTGGSEAVQVDQGQESDSETVSTNSPVQISNIRS